MRPCCYQTITLLTALGNAVDCPLDVIDPVIDALHEIHSQCDACRAVSEEIEKGNRGGRAGPSGLEIRGVKRYCSEAVARICVSQLVEETP